MLLKNYLFVIWYVLDQYKTQQIRDKAIFAIFNYFINGGTLESISDCYLNQHMCDRAVDNYPRALKFVPDCYMIKKCVIKLSPLIILQYNFLLIAIRLKKYVIKLLIDLSLHLLIFLIGIKLKKFVTELRRISEDPFMLVYCPDRYKTQRICDEAVCLTAWKFIPDLFVTTKMLEKVDNA